jgi:TolB protein
MRVAVAVALAAAIGLGFGGQDPPPPRPSGLIVFSAGSYNHLYVADLDQRSVRQLTRGKGGYNPSWSPDGSRVAFDWVSDGPCNSGACSRIFLINADGTRRRPFTSRNLRCEGAAWSPAGDRIAYVQWRPSRADDNRSSIWIRSVDGSAARRVTFAKAAFDSSPVWSPDGTRIIFSRDAQGAAAGNYVVNADGTGLRRLRGNPRTWITSWSSDGQRLLGERSYGEFNNEYLSVVANADGSRERLLVRDGLGPIWSPDDRFVAFLPEDADLVRGWVSVVRADGKGRRKLFTGKFTEPSHLDWIARPAG